MYCPLTLSLAASRRGPPCEAGHVRNGTSSFRATTDASRFRQRRTSSRGTVAVALHEVRQFRRGSPGPPMHRLSNCFGLACELAAGDRSVGTLLGCFAIALARKRWLPAHRKIKQRQSGCFGHLTRPPDVNAWSARPVRLPCRRDGRHPGPPARPGDWARSIRRRMSSIRPGMMSPIFTMLLS